MVDQFDKQHVNGNPQDPLTRRQQEASTRELFARYSQVSNGFAYEDVIGASANMLMNAIRQSCPTAQKAEQAIDQLSARVKGVLLDQHYAPTGKRRAVFPHEQVLRPDFFTARPNFLSNTK